MPESDGFVTVEVMVRQGFLGRDIVITLQTSDGTAVCKSTRWCSLSTLHRYNGPLWPSG